MAIEQEDKIITFENYYDVMLAHIVRTKLEDNGIPCFIADENTLTAPTRCTTRP
jgi:predicted ABC-class ATPase